MVSSETVAGEVMTYLKFATATAELWTPPFQFVGLVHAQSTFVFHVELPPPIGCGGVKFAAGVIATLSTCVQMFGRESLTFSPKSVSTSSTAPLGNWLELNVS